MIVIVAVCLTAIALSFSAILRPGKGTAADGVPTQLRNETCG